MKYLPIFVDNSIILLPPDQTFLDVNEQFHAKFSIVKMTTDTFSKKSAVILKLLT